MEEMTETTVEETTAPIETAEPAEGLEQPAEAETAEESAETNETPEGETEGQPEGEKRPQTTAFERIQELVNKNKTLEETLNATRAALEARLDHVMQTQQTNDPDLLPVDSSAVNTYISEQLDIYDQLKLQGRGAEALDLLESLNKLRADVKTHETKRAEKLNALKEKETQGKTYQQVMQKLNAAAKIVQQEYKLSDEVFNAAAGFFQAEQQKSPVLAARYAEIVERQGEMAAVLFAKSYCDEHMGKPEKQAIEKREAAKNNLPPTASTVSTKALTDEVNALYTEAQKDPGNSDKFLAWKLAKQKLK